MTVTPSPDGAGFNRWATVSPEGDRHATKTELRYINERLADLPCPFCGRPVRLLTSRCVCDRRTVSVACSDTGRCKAHAVVPKSAWVDAESPRAMALYLRRHFREHVSRVRREYPA